MSVAESQSRAGRESKRASAAYVLLHLDERRVVCASAHRARRRWQCSCAPPHSTPGAHEGVGVWAWAARARAADGRTAAPRRSATLPAIPRDRQARAWSRLKTSIVGAGHVAAVVSHGARTGLHHRPRVVPQPERRIPGAHIYSPTALLQSRDRRQILAILYLDQMLSIVVSLPALVAHSPLPATRGFTVTHAVPTLSRADPAMIVVPPVVQHGRSAPWQCNLELSSCASSGRA